MMRPIVVLIAATAFTSQAPRLRAQEAGPNVRDQIELNRQTIEAKRTEIQQQALKLTAEQSEQFWPVYREYQNELSRLGDQKVRLLQTYALSYAGMSEKQADEVLSQWFKLRAQQLDIQRKYQSKFRKVLPAPKVLRVFQMETLMDAVITGNLQASLPLAEEAGKSN
jgi:Spy/CpxP family protein refolding chaperone